MCQHWHRTCAHNPYAAGFELASAENAEGGGGGAGTDPLLAPQEPWHAVKGECGQGRVGFAFASGVESGSAILPPLLPPAYPPGSASTGKSVPPALFPQDAELHQGQTFPVHLSMTSTWFRAWHLKGLINAG